MRLWHYKLIPYLPKSQLLAQWRELNSIFKKQDKHILINYIYDYDKIFMLNYSLNVMTEMENRGYKTKNDNWYEYHRELIDKGDISIINLRDCRYKEQDKEYLTICYYNLKEKYLRGQKDFTKEIWDKLEEFYKKEMEWYSWSSVIIHNGHAYY